MKKTLSLALIIMMVFSALAVFTVSSSAEDTLTVTPYGTGMENWSDQTQVLLTCGDENWTTAKKYLESTWELTFTTNGTSKTVKLVPSSKYDGGTWGIVRFQPCLGTGSNCFIPTKDAEYTLAAKALNADGTTAATATCTGTWKLTVDPIKPEFPIQMTLTASFGKIENYSNRTYFIIGGISKAVIQELKDGTMSAKAVIVDETENKTYTISKYAFDAAKNLEADTGNGLFRLAACEYGIVPVKDHTYTISVEITDAAGTVMYTGTSSKGAFQSTNAAFIADGAIKPENVTHYYDEYKAPVNPPVTGEHTTVIVVLAVVALFGTAVVVSKKVFDK